jgi:hypothetical protein
MIFLELQTDDRREPIRISSQKDDYLASFAGRFSRIMCLLDATAVLRDESRNKFNCL